MQLYLRPRAVPTPLSARIPSQHASPPMHATTPPFDPPAPAPLPLGGDGAEHGAGEVRAMEDLLFDFVSLTIE